MAADEHWFLITGGLAAIGAAFGYVRFVSASVHRRIDAAFKKIGETREEYMPRAEAKGELAALAEFMKADMAAISQDVRYIRDKVDRMAEGGKR